MNKSCLNHHASEKVQPVVGEFTWAEKIRINSKKRGI
jgi:hypothetical protein